MDTRLKKRRSGFFAVWLVAVLLVSCSKDDPSPEEGSEWKTSDIEISNIVAEQEEAGRQVHVSYDVKNVSGKDILNYGTFDIRWTVKDTDGTLYQTERGVPELLKDAVSPQDVYISVSSGKLADLSTVVYEILLDE
ncbi:hypothetical protein [Parapedobacter sp. DT-150]|uniref:hypothetical protein n=1 Tax=Parapedobacter sp. DT-150 TaxID=3396162 RepID=UPI003F1D8B6C